MARVHVINETTLDTEAAPDEWTLWFQWCRYLYDDGGMDYGFRFIWRRPKSEGGSLQAARGQARIPSPEVLIGLQIQADREGWYEFWDHIPNRVAEVNPSGLARQIKITISNPDAARAGRLFGLARAGDEGLALSDAIRLKARVSQFTMDGAKPESGSIKDTLALQRMRGHTIVIAIQLTGAVIANVAAAEIENWLHNSGAQHSESIHIENNRTIKYDDRDHVRQIIESTIVDKLKK